MGSWVRSLKSCSRAEWEATGGISVTHRGSAAKGQRFNGHKTLIIQHLQISLMNSQKKKTKKPSLSWFSIPNSQLLPVLGTFSQDSAPNFQTNCRNSLYPHHTPLSPGIPSSSVDFLFHVLFFPSSDVSLHTLRQQGMFSVCKTQSISFQGSWVGEELKPRQSHLSRVTWSSFWESWQVGPNLWSWDEMATELRVIPH